MTLLFSLTQGAAYAEAGVILISPFVGRITDYLKGKEHGPTFPVQESQVYYLLEQYIIITRNTVIRP